MNLRNMTNIAEIKPTLGTAFLPSAAVSSLESIVVAAIALRI
jgi:hypothetical protein